ncbi:unnamed protein product [Allacma fusca]|uniref:C2H2-type domain-containing protein n=1 Tax=Allacma fusca TaxID=39272 RepID=A0A8J2KL63_9HEXA|nr:unnamed protein product [Allacma fusca]
MEGQASKSIRQWSTLNQQFSEIVPGATKERKAILQELALLRHDTPPDFVPVVPPHNGKFHFRCSSSKLMYRTRRGFGTHLPCVGHVSHSVDKTLQCTLCGKFFEEYRDYEVHYGDKHVKRHIPK